MNESGHESPSEFDAARSRLRQRWELASVLNFFKVFEPVIEGNLKISAEEVETALIIPNKSLAQLHVLLLKGIPPVSKNLKDSDGWVVALSKKLLMWWPWVAEGDFPLTVAKGKEMERYKELDPTVRLVILKALCEIRADQHDAVAYINDGVRNKKELSTFQKSNIGEDGKGTKYWCDGNEIIGFRLYKEVSTFKKNTTLPILGCQWETLATNLEEFQKVVDKFSSSKSKLEVDVSIAVETEVIPVLTKLYKKQQKALQKKKNEERVINNICRPGITRSCRSRRPISYTFDEYDKAINEAIRETKRMKTKDEQRSEKKENVVKENAEESMDGEEDAEESVDGENEDAEESVDGENEDAEESVDGENEDAEESVDGENEDAEDSMDGENEDAEESKDGESSESSSREESGDEEEEAAANASDDEKENRRNGLVVKGEIKNGRLRKKISGNCVGEMRNFGAKKRLRQRPNRNTALVVPDSDASDS